MCSFFVSKVLEHKKSDDDNSLVKKKLIFERTIANKITADDIDENVDNNDGTEIADNNFDSNQNYVDKINNTIEKLHKF